MKTYRLTDEELDALKEALKPVPCLIVGGIPPASPCDKAMAVWRNVASRVGCDVNSIAPANTGDEHDFLATP